MRVILDTNVLISAIFFGGPPGEILKQWRHGRLGIVLSPEIFREYEDVAGELACRYKGADAGHLLDLLAAQAEIVTAAPLPESACVDSDDEKFLACAVAADAKCIVSGDKHLLQASGYRGVEVITPRTFLDRYVGTSGA